MTIEQSNLVFMGFPKVVTTALEELENKLKILKQYGVLEKVISEPRRLMISSSNMSMSLAYYAVLRQKGIEKRRLEEIPLIELLTSKEGIETREEERRGGR